MSDGDHITPRHEQSQKQYQRLMNNPSGAWNNGTPRAPKNSQAILGISSIYLSGIPFDK